MSNTIKQWEHAAEYTRSLEADYQKQRDSRSDGPDPSCDHCGEPVSYCDETQQWFHSRPGLACFLSNGRA